MAYLLFIGRLIYIFTMLFSDIPDAYEKQPENIYDNTIMQEIQAVPPLYMWVKVEEPDKPAMLEARLEGDSTEYYITNTYDSDIISSEVVGMVGVPIKVDSLYHQDMQGELSLVFQYDDTKLEGDETDLGILWYNEEKGWYETLIDFETDFDRNEVTVPVNHLGTYILEDMKVWTAVWNGTYDYENMMLEPECNWYDNFAYEDIELLADTSYLSEETNEYHITTKEQLAGLVKLVNEGNSFYGCDFYLDEDIDLAGYEWAPIGWYYPANDGYLGKDFPFEGRFFGNEHVIFNMSIVAPEHSDIGMFGRTLQSFQVHDLSLVNCYIEGKFYVGGILGDNINSGENFDMTNCHVMGTIKGRQDVGALVGSSAYLRIKDCDAVMKKGSTTQLTGDLRGGYIENCKIEQIN